MKSRFCTHCGTELPTASRFCGQCGTPTEVGQRDGGPLQPSDRRSDNALTLELAGGPGPRSSAAGRFAPGIIIGERYRIISLIGQGGMGEVYRADDLRLDQPVALKFLPEGLAEDPNNVQRLLNEVKLARQVSHPSVCRVYDAGELMLPGEGDQPPLRVPFMTMEFVDGESLASLIKRAGRLPSERAAQIAREMCAGLAAAHERGILHRDLKPANVLIDSDGHAKLADFGLAGLAEDLARHAPPAGTPAYMAPEQVLGQGVTRASDLYSLGLVLYEMFSGSAPFRPRSLEDLKEQHRKGPKPLVEVLPGVDPDVERAVSACLEYKPEQRPPSALSLSAMMPGGDPLLAALSAGITPTPDLIARSGKSRGLSLPIAVTLFVAALVALGIAAVVKQRVSLITISPILRSAPVLTEQARDILTTLGYAPEPLTYASRFDLYEEYLDEVARADASPTRWERLRRSRPSAIDFWYRQSDESMGPIHVTGRVGMSDPPADLRGMISVRLDLSGKLRELRVAVDPAGTLPRRLAEDPPRTSGEPDASTLFALAGLDGSALRPVAPRRVPATFADTRRAWEGAYPESPDEPIRVEAGWYNGVPVAFRIVETRYERASFINDVELSVKKRTAAWVSGLVQAIILVASASLAWFNLVHMRGDRRGTMRIAIIVAGLTLFSTLVSADTWHTRDEDFGVIFWAVPRAVAVGGVIWIFYMALEPYVRRAWPQALLGWTRLLAGRFGDPIVGRDALVGVLLGLFAVNMVFIDNQSPGWLGLPPAAPFIDPSVGVDPLQGTARAMGAFADFVAFGVRFAMVYVTALVVLRVVLRRAWAAAIAWTAIQATIWTLIGQTTPLSVVAFLLLSAACTWASMSYGLVPLVVGSLTYQVIAHFPITTDPSRWHFAPGVVAMGLIAAIAAWGAGVATRRTTG